MVAAVATAEGAVAEAAVIAVIEEVSGAIEADVEVTEAVAAAVVSAAETEVVAEVEVDL